MYYYTFTIKYLKGSQTIFKDYLVCFCDIYNFLCFLESRHKDNYSIINISKFRKPGAVIYEYEKR